MTPYEKKRDCIFALVATAISTLGLVQAFTYPPESSNFPKFLLWLMLLFSVLLLIKNIRTAAVSVDAASAAASRAGLYDSLKTAAFVICGTAVYALAIRYIGYFVGTAAFFLYVMLVYGKNKLLPSLLSLAGFVAVMYSLFVWFLGMRLPEGLLF